MSTREEKEKQQEALDEQKYKKSQQMAILKASNQMLEDAKDAITDKLSGDERQMKKMHKLIDEAKEENLNTGKNYLQAVPQDIENSVYHEANEYYKNKYKQYLETNNLTDEELHNKSYGTPVGNAATAVSSAKKEKRMPKPLSFFKKNSVKPDLEEEVEITEINQKNRTVKGEGYIPDDSDIEEPETVMKKIVSEVSEKKEIKQPETKINMSENVTIKFDPSSIPSYVQYDIIPLPSHGECYKGKQSRLPVRYLTAADENIISSPNMYANGDLMDVILKRCILDKSFNVDDMCIGDRDAVLIWLRETGYGATFPIVARNPETGKEYNTSIDLSTLPYKEFKLKGDENGWFEYRTDGGDEIKFRLLSNNDRIKLRKESTLLANEMRKREISRYAAYIKEYYEENEMEDEESELLINAIDSINEWYANVESENYDNESNNGVYTKNVTNQMIAYTMSVNGNTDRKYIENYVNNMRSMDAIKYRNYVSEHIPGVDMKITVNIPESDGGGSFSTFLGLDDTIFINI